jgi:hypothetical protein
MDREGIGDEDDEPEGDPKRSVRGKVGGGRHPRVRRKVRAISGASVRTRGGSDWVRGGGPTRVAGRGVPEDSLESEPLPWGLGSFGETEEKVNFHTLTSNPVAGLGRGLTLPLPAKPFKILRVGVQYRFKAHSRSRHVSEHQKKLLAPVYVRIMGSKPISYDNISFVAKDLCVLLQMGKSQVRKAVGAYGPTEIKLLPVICCHHDGSEVVHPLLCLTPRGIRRLLDESTFHLAQQVLKWIFDHIDHLCGFVTRRLDLESCRLNPPIV